MLRLGSRLRAGLSEKPSRTKTQSPAFGLDRVTSWEYYGNAIANFHLINFLLIWYKDSFRVPEF